MKRSVDQGDRGADYSTQRLTQRYRFNDPNMDLFFLGALSWGAAGGLSVGEAFYVASQIEDGNPDSWADAFEKQAGILIAQSERWLQKENIRAAGEIHLKTFAAYRSAWQFVIPGERFDHLFKSSIRYFDVAMKELQLPATRFSVAYGGGELPGHYYQSADSTAPTILIIGGADTCHEDRFLSQGRYYFDRGYSVALVDLPGQGLVPNQGLYWELQTEHAIRAVVDTLIERFKIDTKKLVLLGMSLGGYFACRAAAYEPRLAAVIATPALYNPGELFSSVRKQLSSGTPTAAAGANNFQVLLWKAGVKDVTELVEKWDNNAVDPKLVKIPFMSVLGMQEGGVWKKQTREWHEAIENDQKKLITLDAETGADAHCQGNNVLRLVQEVETWLKVVLPA
jgi:dienelactone hydrolase